MFDINCNYFNRKYVGQTRQAIKTLFKEQLAYIKYGTTRKSSVAQHVLGKTIEWMQIP